MQHAVGFEEEITDAFVGEKILEARIVTAFGQPETNRSVTDAVGERAHADLDLPAHRIWLSTPQRQKRMRGGGGDQFHRAGGFGGGECAGEVAAQRLPRFEVGRGDGFVIAGKRMPARIAGGAFHFARGHRGDAVEMTRATFAQKRVVEHGHKRRRERNGNTRPAGSAFATVEHAQQRQVTFAHGLEEPALLEKFRLLGVTHKRQVRVQHQAEATGRCGRWRGGLGLLARLHRAISSKVSWA